MSDILQARDEMGVVTLTLNRPEALNAFTHAMYEELIGVLEGLRYDAQARVVLLTGAGRAFSSGHDLRGGPAASWADPELGRAYTHKRSLSALARIPVLMRGLPQPVIAAVNGPAAGIGFVIAVAADLCLAARSAKFVNAFHNAGTGHELGFSWMLPRAIGTQRAAEILLTGRPVMADEAERIGLVLRSVDDERLMPTVLEVAERIVANVPMGVWSTKQSMWINQGVGSLDAACEIEARAVFMAQQTEDAAEKRRSFLEKRKPGFSNK
jgi:enoyl-CoA hydratase